MSPSLDPWSPSEPSRTDTATTPVECRLHHIPLSALEALALANLPEAQTHFSNLRLTPFLVSDECTRTWKYRVKQLRATPEDGPWVTRILTARTSTSSEGDAVSSEEGAGVHRTEKEIVIGGAGFHGAPDDRGMVEVGYRIDPLYRRRGYGSAALRLMLAIAREQNAKVVRASVGDWNENSIRMVRKEGFVKVGREWDAEDGWEDVWELVL